MKKKLLIVDDHPVVLSGLKAMFEAMEEYELVAALQDPTLVFDYLKSVEVDLLITDLEMPQLHGLSLIKEVKEKHPALKILVLTMNSERSKLEEAVDLGVDGYLLKDSDKDEYLFALKSIFKNKPFFSSSMIDSGILNTTSSYESAVEKDGLTKREIEVLKLVAEGFSNNDIGEKLFLSPKTIDNHRTNIMRKLNAHNVVELVRYALKNNIVELD